jgi:hypothetical protein
MAGLAHLRRRGNVYYYHRRVPLALVKRFGKALITFSLGTPDPKIARKKRDLEDLKHDALFEKLLATPAEAAEGTKTLAPPAIIRLVREYVEGTDQAARAREIAEPGPTLAETSQITQEVEMSRGFLEDREDPNALQWIPPIFARLNGVEGKGLGGRGRFRTGDPIRVKDVLCQLSYPPKCRLSAKAHRKSSAFGLAVAFMLVSRKIPVIG